MVSRRNFIGITSGLGLVILIEGNPVAGLDKLISEEEPSQEQKMKRYFEQADLVFRGKYYSREQVFEPNMKEGHIFIQYSFVNVKMYKQPEKKLSQRGETQSSGFMVLDKKIPFGYVSGKAVADAHKAGIFNPIYDMARQDEKIMISDEMQDKEVLVFSKLFPSRTDKAFAIFAVPADNNSIGILEGIVRIYLAKK